MIVKNMLNSLNYVDIINAYVKKRGAFYIDEKREFSI